MEITTNNVPRDVIEAYELTENERKDFDYLDWKAIEAGMDSRSFFRYKGELYDLGDAEIPTGDLFPGWSAYYSETFFSGVVVKWFPPYDQVIIGRYCT